MTAVRRHGEALRQAILAAALAELTEAGYAGFSMERVAARAGTGKAVVYRRWPGRAGLVLEAVRRLRTNAGIPDTGSLRGDLLAHLALTAELLAGPAGEALRGFIGEALVNRVPLAVLRGEGGTEREAMITITGRAAGRGELDPAALTDLRLDTAQALLRQHVLMRGTPVAAEDLAAMVDEVLVPLLRSPPAR